MIFWRRKPDPHVEEAVNAILEWLGPLLESYGAINPKTKATRDSAEALGKAGAKPNLGEFTVRLVQLTVATLSSKGWKVGGVEVAPTAGAISTASTGDAPLIDLSAKGLAPAVLQGLERAGVDVGRLPDWAKDFQLNVSDLYRFVDAGEATIEAQAPDGTPYRVTVETIWIAGRLGAAVRFKKR